MDPRLADLLRLLTLERIDDNIYRGESRDIGSPQVYGGQVLGQALRAAYATVAVDHAVHSFHAYFLRRGDFNAQIVYNVDRARDGRSFSSRRVTAIQHGEQIFNLSASFQVRQPGIEHQLPMPTVPAPETLSPTVTVPESMAAKMSLRVRTFYDKLRPFEFRFCEPFTTPPGQTLSLTQSMWFRSIDRLPDDDVLHRCLLAYASDYGLLGSAIRPHLQQVGGGHLVMASIDHAMWFHHPVRVDDWLLYHFDSPSASGARGFARGGIYSRDGRLLASTAQEGLVRIVDDDGAPGKPAP
jgi:acyl-CoA thioesterase-2